MPAGPRAGLAADILPGSFQVIGHDDLAARGLNAGLAIAGRCAYVGSRGQGPIAIVDIGDPARPSMVGTLPGRALTTARELRALPSRRLLAVLSFALGAGGANRLDLYRWDQDCSRLAPAGTFDFGRRPPHEMYLWRDPGGDRVLFFVSMFAGGQADLQVVDATDPAHPALAGTWASPAGMLHSISLDAAGDRAYLSLWRGGLMVADSSQFTTGRPDPRLIPLTPPSQALPAPPGGDVHSAVELGGRGLALLTDERYPPACPYGPARLADVSDPAHPRPLAVLAAPENDPATCLASVPGTYTSHNPTVAGDVALISWYSSGLQAFDVSDPAAPVRLAEFRPQGSQPRAVDAQLGATQAMTWSYPIVQDGVVYVADINQGLYALRYLGPRQDDVAKLGFAEGNSNLSAPARPAATAPPGRVASPAGTTAPRPDGGSVPGLIRGAAVALGALLAVAAALLTRRRLSS
jgi:hypothetical protein